MKNYFLCTMIFSAALINAAQHYSTTAIDIKFGIFMDLIRNSPSIAELNSTIHNFAQWDKGNINLVKTDNRFKAAIQHKKREIINTNLKQAQEIFDEKRGYLEALFGSGKFDLLTDGPNARDAQSQMPALIIAAGSLRSTKLVILLLNAGADPNILREGLSPLFYLFPSKYGQSWAQITKENQDNILEILNLLVEAGADVNMINDKNETILDRAHLAHEGSSPRVKYIEAHGAKTAQQLIEEKL